MEINLIIRDLLAKHNYISLPGLGSFIQKYEPAHPSADGKCFIAPRQSIAFDDSRTFNDEAIENYLCESQGISHSDAAERLSAFVKKIQSELNEGKECLFENIGSLRKNKNGRLEFEQAKELNAATATFGLKDITVTKTIKEKSTGTPAKPAPAFLKEKAPRKVAIKILIGIAIILVIGAITATFVLMPEVRFWESTPNTHVELAKSKIDTLKKIDTSPSQANTQPDAALSKKDTLTTKVDQTITNNSNKKTALYYEEPKNQNSKAYYLIVGSFGKMENAQKLAEKFNGKGFKTEIIEGKDMYRVSINRFADKNSAISEFNKFRNSYPEESIWLLGI